MSDKADILLGSAAQQTPAVTATAHNSTDSSTLSVSGAAVCKLDKMPSIGIEGNKVERLQSVEVEDKIDKTTSVEGKTNKTSAALPPETGELANKCNNRVPSAGIDNINKRLDHVDHNSDSSGTETIIAKNAPPMMGPTEKTELDSSGTTKEVDPTKVSTAEQAQLDSAKADNKLFAPVDGKANNKAKQADKKHAGNNNQCDLKFQERIEQILLRMKSISEKLKPTTSTAMQELGATPTIGLCKADSGKEPSIDSVNQNGKESSNDSVKDSHKEIHVKEPSKESDSTNATSTAPDTTNSDPPPSVAALPARAQKLGFCLRELADTLDRDFYPSLRSRLEQERMSSTRSSTLSFITYLQGEIDLLKRQTYQIEDLVYSNSVQHHLILDQILVIVKNAQRISEEERFSQIKQLVLSSRHKYNTLKIFRSLTKVVNGTFAGGSTLKKIKKQVLQYKQATTQSQALIHHGEFEFALIEKVEPVLTEMASFLLQLKLLKWTFEMKIGK